MADRLFDWIAAGWLVDYATDWQLVTSQSGFPGNKRAQSALCQTLWTSNTHWNLAWCLTLKTESSMNDWLCFKPTGSMVQNLKSRPVDNWLSAFLSGVTDKLSYTDLANWLTNQLTGSCFTRVIWLTCLRLTYGRLEWKYMKWLIFSTDCWVLSNGNKEHSKISTPYIPSPVLDLRKPGTQRKS